MSRVRRGVTPEENRRRLVARLLSGLRDFGYTSLTEVEVDRALTAYENGTTSDTNVIEMFVKSLMDEAKAMK